VAGAAVVAAGGRVVVGAEDQVGEGSAVSVNAGGGVDDVADVDLAAERTTVDKLDELVVVACDDLERLVGAGGEADAAGGLERCRDVVGEGDAARGGLNREGSSADRCRRRGCAIKVDGDVARIHRTPELD
jgi:hypothetical protein